MWTKCPASATVARSSVRTPARRGPTIASGIGPQVSSSEPTIASIGAVTRAYPGAIQSGRHGPKPVREQRIRLPAPAVLAAARGVEDEVAQPVRRRGADSGPAGARRADRTRRTGANRGGARRRGGRRGTSRSGSSRFASSAGVSGGGPKPSMLTTCRTSSGTARAASVTCPPPMLWPSRCTGRPMARITSATAWMFECHVYAPAQSESPWPRASSASDAEARRSAAAPGSRSCGRDPRSRDSRAAAAPRRSPHSTTWMRMPSDVTNRSRSGSTAPG